MSCSDCFVPNELEKLRPQKATTNLHVVLVYNKNFQRK